MSPEPAPLQNDTCGNSNVPFIVQFTFYFFFLDSYKVFLLYRASAFSWAINSIDPGLLNYVGLIIKIFPNLFALTGKNDNLALLSREDPVCNNNRPLSEPTGPKLFFAPQSSKTISFKFNHEIHAFWDSAFSATEMDRVLIKFLETDLKISGRRMGFMPLTNSSIWFVKYRIILMDSLHHQRLQNQTFWDSMCDSCGGAPD